ncbi:MAG: tRNA (adenosine(37)-N6)-threonylcarbamoyltransferase complex ATPase subunit type 1 TsaE [Lentisphaerae bacterium]|nr:tRNA (adenosine(37)-N6)-threonylcarbamoyltransferase complex ATPase subunit type 1 TsaE [Lentisphaerota bacterium]
MVYERFFMKKIISHSESETAEFARNLATTLPMGSVLTLNGDLGAGKTVFARGFARGLGIDEAVSSPTYTIVQEYLLPDEKHRLYHLDLYRISGAEAALAFGVDEFLNDPKAVALVEWPERIGDVIPENAIKIDIRHLNENEREITLYETQS